jgi:hypothetical protein
LRAFDILFSFLIVVFEKFPTRWLHKMCNLATDGGYHAVVFQPQ